MFALIPHIVRGQELSELNERALDVGTGTSIELRRKIESPGGGAPQGSAFSPKSARAAAGERGASAESAGSRCRRPGNAAAGAASAACQPGGRLRGHRFHL